MHRSPSSRHLAAAAPQSPVSSFFPSCASLVPSHAPPHPAPSAHSVSQSLALECGYGMQHTDNDYYNQFDGDAAFASSLLVPPPAAVAFLQECDTKHGELAQRVASDLKLEERRASASSASASASVLVAPPQPRDEKKSNDEDEDGSEALEHVERGLKQRADEETRRQAQYRDMKLRYMRSLAMARGPAATAAGAGTAAKAAAFARGMVAADAAASLATSSSSSSLVSRSGSRITADEQRKLQESEMMQKRREDQSPFAVVPALTSPPPSPSPSSAAPKPGLLSRLLSSRSASGAPSLSRPTSLSPPDDSHVPPSPQSSFSFSFSSSSLSSSVSSRSERSTPIMIPSRASQSSGGAGAPDGGVRYRKARPMTRAELEHERKQHLSAAAAALNNSAHPQPTKHASSEFTFSDVFEVREAAPSASSRTGAGALPSRLLDQFLA